MAPVQAVSNAPQKVRVERRLDRPNRWIFIHQLELEQGLANTCGQHIGGRHCIRVANESVGQPPSGAAQSINWLVQCRGAKKLDNSLTDEENDVSC